MMPQATFVDVLARHVGMLDREWGERGEAVVVSAPAGEQVTAAELMAFCRNRLARSKVPERFHSSPPWR